MIVEPTCAMWSNLANTSLSIETSSCGDMVDDVAVKLTISEHSILEKRGVSAHRTQSYTVLQ